MPWKRAAFALRWELQRPANCCRSKQHCGFFVRVEGIEPTNNAAERAVRHAVQWPQNQLWDGRRSRQPIRVAHLSVVATCRQQGRHVLDYLTKCCEASLQGDTAPRCYQNPRPDRSNQQPAPGHELSNIFTSFNASANSSACPFLPASNRLFRRFRA